MEYDLFIFIAPQIQVMFQFWRKEPQERGTFEQVHFTIFSWDDVPFKLWWMNPKDKDITESVGDHHTIIVYHCCLPLQYLRLILNIPCFYHILPCDYPNMYITMRKFRGIDGIDS